MNNQIFLNGITLEQLAEALAPLIQTSQSALSQQSELIGRKEVCEMLGINLTSLWKHTKSGRLTSYGIGNRVLYKRSEVLEAITPLNPKN
jgi:excisionase family DNA binding protein